MEKNFGVSLILGEKHSLVLYLPYIREVWYFNVL